MNQTIKYVFILSMFATGAFAQNRVRIDMPDEERLARIENWLLKVQASIDAPNKRVRMDATNDVSTAMTAPSVYEDLKTAKEYFDRAVETVDQRLAKDGASPAAHRPEIAKLNTIRPYIVNASSQISSVLTQVDMLRTYSANLANATDNEERRVIRMAIEKQIQRIPQIAYRNLRVDFHQGGFVSNRVGYVDDWLKYIDECADENSLCKRLERSNVTSAGEKKEIQ